MEPEHLRYSVHQMERSGFWPLLAALFGPESASFYFIEELETGVHPSRLSLLVNLIENQTKRGESRLWRQATRHSYSNS